MIENRAALLVGALVGVVEFVFDGLADPGRDGAVFGFGALSDLLQPFGCEPDWHHRGQSGAAPWWSVGLLAELEDVLRTSPNSGAFASPLSDSNR